MIYCVMRKYPDNLSQPHPCRPVPIACRRCFLLRKWADGGFYSAETSACIHVPLACHSRGNLFRFQFNFFGTYAPSVCLSPWNVFSFQLCFFGHAHPFRLSLALKFSQISLFCFGHSRPLCLALALKFNGISNIFILGIHVPFACHSHWNLLRFQLFDFIAYMHTLRSNIRMCKHVYIHACKQIDRQTHIQT